MYKPKTSKFITPIRILRRTEALVNGAPDVSYPPETATDHLCRFKSFHGAETLYAGQLGFEDGGTVEMWYDPTVKLRDRVLLHADATQAYEIISPPENVEQRNMFLVFRVSRVVMPDAD